MELDYGPFRRQIQLGEDIDVDRATATFERGILKVVLPIAQRVQTTERVAIVVRRA
jgi:HSP20 family molecular chaperone IbpA